MLIVRGENGEGGGQRESSAAVFDKGRGAGVRGYSRIPHLFSSSFSLIFFFFFFFFHFSSSHLFSLFVASLPPAAAPHSFLTLTADARCSGKSVLDGEGNKCTTKPKAASFGLRVHISISVLTFSNAIPKNRRSLLLCCLKHFLPNVPIDYRPALMK